MDANRHLLYKTNANVRIVNINSEVKDLISLACEGKRDAQKALYQRYSPKILSVCRQYISDDFHAEDCLVVSFTKIFKYLKTYDHRGHFEAWMRRIAVNECISFIRANKNVTFVEVDQALMDVIETDSAIRSSDIQLMIDKLPEGCRIVFNLFAIEGYKHNEIAEKLKISEGTSKSQLAYARKLLQEIIQKSDLLKHHG